MRFMLLLGVVVALVYATHFENAFQFDDSHSIVDNPHIRDLSFIPQFFVDARTFGTLPQNQQYRPLVSTSLAIDYWLGGGLRPTMFHISTFLWFLLQLALMYRLFRALGERAEPRLAYGVACFATAWYALHPVTAETINYVIQRGEVYATLGIVAGLLIYVNAPARRRTGLYLLPVLLGLLSKEITIVFPALLFGYVRAFEQDTTTKALRQCLPATLVCLAAGCFVLAMRSPSHETGGASYYAYWITQPLVILRYAGALFLPLHLSADSDYQSVASLFERGAWAALVVLTATIPAVIWCTRYRLWRPVAFGLWWYLLALMPTSVLPLAEVENTHRMYLPFVGLVLACSWTAAVAIERWWPVAAKPRWLSAACVALLCAYAWGALQRNMVWRSEESLWRDVTIKSPHNPRGLMNYGLTLMAKGEAGAALEYFERAAMLSPAYPVLEINRGIANGELGNDAAARVHFERALTLAPREARGHYFYARWLLKQGRQPDAIAHLQAACEENPAFLEAAHLLMAILSQEQRWGDLERMVAGTLRRFPGDAAASSYQDVVRAAADEIVRLRAAASAAPSADTYVDLSLLLYRFERFSECVDAARHAVALRPDSAEAYNNIAAAYAELEQWEEAIAAARAALRVRPDFPLARNNLAWAERERDKTRSKKS